MLGMIKHKLVWISILSVIEIVVWLLGRLLNILSLSLVGACF